MKVVYVCAPYSAELPWKVEVNTRLAELAALGLAHEGVSVIVPHTMSRFWGSTLPDAYWYAATLELMRRADGIVVVGDWRQSRGCVGEVKEALARGLPIFDLSGPLHDEWGRFQAWARA